MFRFVIGSQELCSGCEATFPLFSLSLSLSTGWKKSSLAPAFVLLTAATGGLLLRFANIDTTASAAGASRTSLLILGELLGDGQKDVINVHCRLGGSFHEEKAIFVRISLRLVGFHCPLVCQVGLVSGQRDHNVRTGLSL